MRFVGIARSLIVVAAVGIFALLTVGGVDSADPPPAAKPASEFASVARPLIEKYCLQCHSTKVKKGSLDLERFTSAEQIRKDLKPWQMMVELLEAKEMPPKGKPQPSEAERKRLIGWTQSFLDAEAKASAGDPGYVPLHRLSNAEYDCTIRDLTGVDLRPTREFPADGAGGEGFTNASESLSDISPTLLNKYLNAAKEIANHAVLLPDGFRFSPAKTRRDWTNEANDRIRDFYRQITSDGRLPLQPYLSATIRHRDDLIAGKETLENVAQREKLNAKYLRILWTALSDKSPSFPLDQIRARWRTASEKDIGSILAEISALQTPLWRYVPIGSYRDNQTIRQLPNDPAFAPSRTLTFSAKPEPGQSEIVLYLSTRQFSASAKEGRVIWQRPRFEGGNQPTSLLRDYATYGPRFEIDYAAIFADTPKYLAAAVEAANNPKLATEAIAKKHGLNATLLERWIDTLAVEPYVKDTTEPRRPRKIVTAVPLALLDEKTPALGQKPSINGWRKKGAELPSLVTNSSEIVEHVPGRVSPHHVAVHPTPTEFVAAVWKSPVDGHVRVSGKIVHAHPACGNGVAWWIEHRHTGQSAVLGEAGLGVGQQAQFLPRTIKVAKGDIVMLAIDARDASHVCDLTDINLTVTDADQPGRSWDLAADISGNVMAANPHADKAGNKEVWSFVRGPAKPVGYFSAAGPSIPAGSILAKWRDAATDPNRKQDARKLAEQAQALLSGKRPAASNQPDRVLFDNLVSLGSPLFQGIDWSQVANSRRKTMSFGLPKDRFGGKAGGDAIDEASLIASTNEVIEVRLPVALFRDRQFAVDCKLESASSDRAVQFQVLTSPPAANAAWDGKSPIIAVPGGAAHKQLLAGLAEFRRCFPPFICFPQIIPTDEVVCLKMFHREDEPLVRLFLDSEQKDRLDRLWQEQRFICQQPIAENRYLPLFIGFVTQDQPKELLAFYEGQRPAFKKRADEFEKELEAAIPKQLDMLVEFASRAYRRPLRDGERAELLQLYQTIRSKQIPHDEAFRTILARMLVSPSFLFHLEQSPPGKDPQPINDWELASRLSYLLWSSVPDAELRKAAALGRLHEPDVLTSETLRMLKDPKIRSLAIEFGTQWIHVRGFDELKEKNERLFPMFDETLRKAIYEESILFFQDLFQNHRPVTRILDANYTYLNETLAKHYGISGVSGPEWRKVDGVQKFGRGGILGLASVQTKESGASRTSPILRGNWLVETVLGEKLPRPPPNVPKLPEDETGNDGLSTRQLVERHTKDPACASCHVRIDPFGFALEKYDPIGRRREKDLNGLPLDSKVKLKDGTEFDGIAGLRNYLLSKKKDLIVRLFCKRLLGYALGRSVALSDQKLIDEMVSEANKNDGRITAAVLAIVRSPQFRMIRGMDRLKDE